MLYPTERDRAGVRRGILPVSYLPVDLRVMFAILDLLSEYIFLCSHRIKFFYDEQS